LSISALRNFEVVLAMKINCGFDFYLPLCYHIPRFERGLKMTGEEFLSVSACGCEYYFAYYYAYAKASGKSLHARRILLH
jgi:hypothetical protein